jgi:hypothetical protein
LDKSKHFAIWDKFPTAEMNMVHDIAHKNIKLSVTVWLELSKIFT